MEWCDALVNGEGWLDKAEILLWVETEQWVIRQVGYLLLETKEYIVLASKYNPHEKTEDMYAELTKIPKTWIRKRRAIYP